MTAQLVTTAEGLRADARRRTGRRAVVMTMGALHEGHAELMREARRQVGDAGVVIATVFVNPTQFTAGEDFERYPRTLQADIDLASTAGVDVVFAPDAVDVYGAARGFTSDSVTVDAGPLGEILEGAARPGHFRGVLTVVAKLMGLTRPDVALYGEKDYQQLVLIRRMVRDLSLPVEIVGVPTVREPDGFARSSRNRYLSETERAAAQALPEALAAAVAAAQHGAEAAIAAGNAVIAAGGGIDLDYLVVTDPELGPAPVRGEARILVAAKVGATRLIDNRAATVGA